MDISNVTPVTPSVAKATGVTGTNKPVAGGNALPGAGQVGARLENPLSATPAASQKNQKNDTVSTPQPNDTVSTPQPNTEELHNLVNQANTALQERFSDLKFTVAEGTDITVVRIEDTETGELIRQFPSEAMVAIARALGETQHGTMLEEKV